MSRDKGGATKMSSDEHVKPLSEMALRVKALEEELAAAGLVDPASGEAGERSYYACWLAALESLVATLGLVSGEGYAERKAHLRAHPPNSHDHVARRSPIRIA